jgi:hypothetical protein
LQQEKNLTEELAAKLAVASALAETNSKNISLVAEKVRLNSSI